MHVAARTGCQSSLRLCAADPRAREEFTYNLLVYVRGEKANLWTLQNVMKHCALRLATELLLQSVMQARIADVATNGT